MLVNVLRNRGVVVVDPKRIGGLIVDLEECVDLEILDCRFGRFKGLSGYKWAEKWLYESSRRPMKILTAIVCKTSKIETVITVKRIKKEFQFTTSRRNLKGEGHLIQEGLR